jgi:hypothetical protein
MLRMLQRSADVALTMCAANLEERCVSNGDIDTFWLSFPPVSRSAPTLAIVVTR